MQETSLRTPRRATRKPTLPPQGAPMPGQPIPRPGAAAKARVDDRIKKRMSMRYAEFVTSPTSMEPLPPMPGLPAGLGQDAMMSFGDGMGIIDEDAGDRGASIKEDKKILEDDNFDPDAYLKAKLANSTEAEVRSLQSSLRNAKEDTNLELQQNVFKNYAEFVQISKEITTLESDLLELKDILSEYKYMPFLLHVPDPTIQSANPNILSTYKRSSIADLRIMYHNQMQELHASIEGAVKFAPTTPGRHVVAEVEGVYSLNSATYKVIGKVRFVVLDDLVLVARRRRRKAGADGSSSGANSVNEGKLVAERCWPIHEMLVLDTKDSPRMTNVFKIRQGKETHVYRTDTLQEKKSLLSQLRQVAEELAAKKRKEREGEHERRKSLWQATGGDRGSVAAMPEWMADLALRGGELPEAEMDGGAKSKSERDTRWVAEWSDDLTVAIALREWEKAVNLVEEGHSKAATIPTLANKLTVLSARLTSSLLEALAVSSNRKAAVVSLISYLIRLKAGSAARSTFLQTRTKVLKSHLRRIVFDGNITTCVGELAVIYFTAIKHTADWFLASFKENEVASAFIDWVKDQLEDFAATFRKQVFTADVDEKTVEDALKIVHAQSKKLLQEYGLDFRYLFDALLVKNPVPLPKPEAANQPFEPKLPQGVPQFTFDQPPTIEPVPSSRKRTPAPPETGSQTLSVSGSRSRAGSVSTRSRSGSSAGSSKPPALNLETLVPPASAASARSNPPSPGGMLSPMPSAPPGSGYSSVSNYSNATNFPNNTPGVSAMSATFNLPDRERSKTPASTVPGTTAPLRPRTPGSAAPPRTKTPVSAAPPRTRTPVSAAPTRTPRSVAPSLPSLDHNQDDTGGAALASPVPRNAIISPLRPARNVSGSFYDDEDGRPPRHTRMSPAPPPKSTNRPGSTLGRQSNLGIQPPQREGMF